MENKSEKNPKIAEKMYNLGKWELCKTYEECIMLAECWYASRQ